MGGKKESLDYLLLRKRKGEKEKRFLASPEKGGEKPNQEKSRVYHLFARGRSSSSSFYREGGAKGIEERGKKEIVPGQKKVQLGEGTDTNIATRRILEIRS